MATKIFTAIVHLEEDIYVAECPEAGTISQDLKAWIGIGSKCVVFEDLDWVKIQVYLSVKIQVNGSARSCEGLDRVSI